jgi:tight adherence protein B
MLSSSIFPALLAFAGVTSAMLVLADFVIFIASRYRERYLRETSAELDDVLIQMPPSRVLDLGIALSVAGATVSMVIFASSAKSHSLLWSVITSLIVALMIFPLPRLILRFLRNRRIEKFDMQLEDALNSMSSSLKAGFSITQALEEIASQDIHPLSVEFRLLVQEIRLGVPVEQALDNMCRRLECDDFELVASAIITARQTGGELTKVLERVSELIRERLRINRKVRAMTAMGRMQAMIIGAVPYLLLLGLNVVSPEMMSGFFSTPTGFIALALVTVLVIAGFITIRKITRIEV